jgi:cytoskeletal protein RodZ
MKTVGQMLSEARISQSLTLEEVERGTKIRTRFIQAIESDTFERLPSVSYAKGFVKNYSEYLGMDSTKVLAFFRRQTEDITKSTLLPKGIEHPLNRSWFQLTPGKFIALVVVALVIIFLLYLGFQYQSLNKPPFLILDSPKNQMVTSDFHIDVLGRTDSDATVTINGISVLVRSDGKFFDQVVLEPGVNTIKVISTSRFGKTTTLTREIGIQTGDGF